MPITLEKLNELMGVEELPGTPEQIQEMLRSTEWLIGDHGEQWITQNRHRLLYDWEFIIQNM
jgi:hypothetical protein